MKSFWTKIDRVVAYKQRLEVDEQRRKTMDKHLVFLVRQTEGYSSALAATYQTSFETERELAAADAADAAAGAGASLRS